MLFKAVQSLPNGYTVVEDERGYQMPVAPANLEAMRASGTLMSDAGPMSSMAPPPQPQQQLRPQGRAAGLGNAPLLQQQRMGQPQQQPHPNARATQAAPAAAGGAPLGPPPIAPAPTPAPARNFSRVQAPQTRQLEGTRVTTPQFEMVKTPGRAAGWRDTTQTKVGLADEQQQDLLSTESSRRAKEEAALEMKAEADRSRFEAEAETAREEAANKRIDADLAEFKYLDRKKFEEDELSKLDAKWDQVDANKIDRDRVWKDKGWGAALLAAISIGFGEYAAKLGGGSNGALQLIDRMIDRDIAAQEHDNAVSRTKLQREQQKYDKYTYGGALEHKEEAKGLRELAAAAQLREEAANSELAYLAPSMMEMAALLEEKSGNRRQSIYETIKQSAAKQYDPGSPGGVAIRETPQSKLSRVTTSAKADVAKDMETIAKVENPQANSKDTVRDINGNVLGINPNAAELNPKIQAWSEVEDSFDILEQKLDKGSIVGSDADFKAEANNVMLKLADTNSFRLGSDTDVELIGSLIGGTDRSRVARAKQKQVLKEARQRVRRNLKTNLRQQGLAADWVDDRPAELESE